MFFGMHPKGEQRGISWEVALPISVPKTMSLRQTTSLTHKPERGMSPVIKTRKKQNNIATAVYLSQYILYGAQMPTASQKTTPLSLTFFIRKYLFTIALHHCVAYCPTAGEGPMESLINRSVRTGVQSGRFSPSGTARWSGQGCQRSPTWVTKTVVPKVGSFTWCAVCQYTHRAEVLSLVSICTDMGAR